MVRRVVPDSARRRSPSPRPLKIISFGLLRNRALKKDDSVINSTLNKDGEIDSVLVRLGGVKGQYEWTVYQNGVTNKSAPLTFRGINGRTDDGIISLLGQYAGSAKTTVTTSTYVTTDPIGSNAESEFIASGLSKDSDGYYCDPSHSGIDDQACYPKGGDVSDHEARGGMLLMHTSQIYDMNFQGLASEISNPVEEQSFVTRVNVDDPGIVTDRPKDGAVTVVG